MPKDIETFIEEGLKCMIGRSYGSYRVMERNGMRRDAVHIKKFWARVDREWIDEVVYAILAEEYRKVGRCS